MTAPSGGPLPGGWKPSPYQAAVMLSGVSAVLGLGRELLVYRQFGFGTANDSLQFALSITYTVALLGEPLRLGALNLLQRRLGAPLWAAIATGIVLAAALTTALYGAGTQTVPRAWLLVAGAAGAANLFLSWVLPRRQRAGPFLPVHAITVMPSYIMVPALLLPAASAEAFAARVVGLFLIAPLAQLVALALLYRFGDRTRLDPPLPVTEALRPIGWHAVGAAGGQAAQVFMRRALFLAPAGTLSAFSTILRVTDSLRAIFVDTYIASRIRRWAAGERSSSPIIDGRWLTPGALAAIAGSGLLLALSWGGRPGTWQSPVAAMVVLGAYLVLALRVRYQLLNTSAQPMGLVKRMAGLELIAALLVGVSSVLSAVPVALLPWVVYVAKPAAGLGLIAAHPVAESPLAPEA